MKISNREILVCVLAVLLTGCGKFNSAPVKSSSLGSSTPTPPSTPPVQPSSNLPIVDVLVAYAGLRVSSIDNGNSWQYTSDQTLYSDCWAYRDIAYGGGVFVGVTGTAGFGRISTSPDGVHWREFETNGGSDGIVYGGGKFVAQTFSSTDGYNINLRQINANVGGHGKFAYLNGTYVIGGDQGGIAISTDGDNFTTVFPNYATSTSYGTYIENFATGNGLIVGVGPGRIATSADGGMTWTNHDNYFASAPAGTFNEFFTIVFDGTNFVINGRGYPVVGGPLQPTIWTSADGINFTMSAPSSPVYYAGGSADAHLFGVSFDDSYLPSGFFTSIDHGLSWLTGASVTLSPFYEFSTPQNPVANPVLTSFAGIFHTGMASGRASSDPNIVPTLPASVLYSHAALVAACGAPGVPPGR